MSDNTDEESFNTKEEDVQRSAILEKLTDSLIPGLQVEFDPEEAELAGAFVEDALSEKDALESSIDLQDAE
jgi:hypothetical protein